MKKTSYFLKASIFALGLAAFGLAPVTQAAADHKNNRHHYNNHNKHHYYNNHKRHYYNHHNRWRGHYGYNHHNHGGRGGEVALGMLTGGLLFYALTANQNKDYHRNNNRTVYVQQQPVYVQPQQQWANTRPAQPQDSSCLQVREYQTTITVGGQNVPAYGQSCLQPDGSWKLGPAIPEPGY